MLGCVHRTNSLAAAFSVTFIASTIAAIVRLYCKDKMGHSSECKRLTRFEQISTSYLAARMSTDGMLGGVRRTNSLAVASSVILTYVDDVMPKIRVCSAECKQRTRLNNFLLAA